MSEEINAKISKIINEETTIDNVYSNVELVHYYNTIALNSSFLNDAEFYEKNIKKSDYIVELAAGSGRILKYLVENGYEITGIELEKEMIDSLDEKYQRFIVNEDMFNVSQLENIYSKANFFILAATSISLFNEEYFLSLLKNIISINKSFSIIFDLADIETLVSEKPYKEINQYGTFYYINFQSGNNIIYNLFHKESNTLGISKKHIHNKEKLIKLLKEQGFEVSFYELSKNYYAIKGVYNGK